MFAINKRVLRDFKNGGLNFLGLVAGFVTLILILLLLRYDLSFDRWLPNSERIYRLEISIALPGTTPRRMPLSMPAAAPVLADRFDAIAQATRLTSSRSVELMLAGRRIGQPLKFADERFFEIFAFRFLHGSPASALNRPDALVLTESAARRLFGETGILGRTIARAEGEPFVVTGVIADPPTNTHFEIAAIGSLASDAAMLSAASRGTWTRLEVYTYFLLDPGASIDGLSKDVHDFFGREIPGVRPGGTDGRNIFQPRLVALPDIHLHSTASGQMKPPGDITLVRALAGAFVLVVAITALNFVNLSVASVLQRAREIGIRKLLGASWVRLLARLVIERGAFVGIAVLASLPVVAVTAPAVLHAIGADAAYGDVIDGLLVAQILLLAALVTAVGAGVPAYRLTRMRPGALFDTQRTGFYVKGGTVRAAFLGIQVAVASFLVITALIVTEQTRYARTFDRGIAISGRYLIESLDTSDAASGRTLQRQLEALPGIHAVSATSARFPMRQGNAMAFESDAAAQVRTTLSWIGADTAFKDALELELLAGRWFSDAISTDKFRPNGPSAREHTGAAVVLTRGAAAKLGFASPAGAVGQTVTAQGNFEGSRTLEVIGVVRDVYWRSATEEPEPTAFLFLQGRLPTLILEPEPGTQLPRQEIESLWGQMTPGQPLRLVSMETAFGSVLEAEQNRSLLFAIFSASAILIAAAGLYAVSAYVIQSRKMELSLRRLFGARTMNLLLSVFNTFYISITVSLVISFFAAYFYNQQWLENFSARISLDAGPFLIAFLMTGLIAGTSIYALLLKILGSRPVNILNARE